MTTQTDSNNKRKRKMLLKSQDDKQKQPYSGYNIYRVINLRMFKAKYEKDHQKKYDKSQVMIDQKKIAEQWKSLSKEQREYYEIPLKY